LLNSRIVVFLIARTSVISDWCIKELHMARNYGIPIIPVIYHKVDLDAEVESLLFGKKRIDFSDENLFPASSTKLAQELKTVLSLLRTQKENQYNTIPSLDIRTLWKQNFLCLMIETFVDMEHSYLLEEKLRKSGIFTYTHSLFDKIQSVHMEKNKYSCCGFIFLVKNLKKCREVMAKWRQFADDYDKRIYLCMVKSPKGAIRSAEITQKSIAEPSDALVTTETSTPVPPVFVEPKRKLSPKNNYIEIIETNITEPSNALDTTDTPAAKPPKTKKTPPKNNSYNNGIDGPIFYLDDELSVRQLVYFIYLHLRESFLEEKMQDLEETSDKTAEQLAQKDQEINNFKKRFAKVT